MKLFKVEFADETHIQVASHPDEAIELVRIKTTIDFLPYTAQEIILDGYELVKKECDIPFSEIPIDIPKVKKK